MSSDNGDWQSAPFRQKVIVNIDDALKKSANKYGSQNEKSAAEIEEQIIRRSRTRDDYLSKVARVILHLQPGGQNQPQPAPSMSQGPMTPMMQSSNMQQSGQMMVSDPNALGADNHHLAKMMAQPSPMSAMSTPSPKIPMYQSPSPAPVQQVKQAKPSGVRTVQVGSNAAYPSPSPIIPSPSPAGHSPAPASSPAQFSAQSPSSLLASKISGIPSVESPGSFNPPSNLNLGSQESPGKTDLSDKDEQLYVEKLKQLSVYTEPLRKMIAKMQNEEDAANKDSKNLTKLKRLLSILGNPKERVPYQALLKVEDVLRRKLPFEGKSSSEPVPIGHSFLEVLQGQAKTNSPQSNNRLFQMLAPTLGTIHGPPICPPQVPRRRHENHEQESPLPHVVKSEIAQLTSKFSIDYANEGDDSREQCVLVCSINDKTLPAVPDLVVRLPADYPSSSPHFDTKDYETSDFLKRIKDRLKNKLVSLPRMNPLYAMSAPDAKKPRMTLWIRSSNKVTQQILSASDIPKILTRFDAYANSPTSLSCSIYVTVRCEVLRFNLNMARRMSQEDITSTGVYSLPGSTRDAVSNISGANTKASSRFSRYSTPQTNTRTPTSKNNSPRGKKPPAPKQPGVKEAASSKKKTTNPNTAITPRKPTMLAPKGYTVRPIVPASKAELLPVARAMNREDFAPRLKKLFDPEREAALEAIETGIYIGWRCPEFKHDCIRVGKMSKCFCGHVLTEHGSYHGNSVSVPCRACECKAFAFVPARPEDVGEWWLKRRPNFDASTWRAKCKCKHTHEQHSPMMSRKCRMKSCPCAGFNSAFLCAACDRHWEEHVTVFESGEHRRVAGIPYGQHYLPFHEMPELRNVVLTGREDDSSMYEELASGPYAIPENKPSSLALQLRGDPGKKPR